MAEEVIWILLNFCFQFLDFGEGVGVEFLVRGVRC